MSPTPDLPPKITPTQPDGGGHLYACCNCCGPPADPDWGVYAFWVSTCTTANEHPAPCVMCGQR